MRTPRMKRHISHLGMENTYEAESQIQKLRRIVEWLQGAGEFNMLEQIPQEMWDMLEMMIKAKKNS